MRNPIAVSPVIVFVDLDTHKLKQEPDGVLVTTRRRLVALLRSRPPTLRSDEIEAIFAQARLSTTWMR